MGMCPMTSQCQGHPQIFVTNSWNKRLQWPRKQHNNHIREFRRQLKSFLFNCPQQTIKYKEPVVESHNCIKIQITRT